ncbi:MAG TPA: polysaccharide biosynthesis C-terminal domain-containing protein, partial [Flavipsychrobacter sp.]|nr:polysaccharide biosynthesis C-terminal domain-containing protein [Flavipsychrobacter sp.]
VFTNRYIAAVPIFAWSIVVLPLRCYGFTAILQKRQQGSLINKGAILDLVVAVALMYPMYRWMGLPGVALSFVISTYVQAGYYLFHTARLVQQPLQSLVPLAFWGKQLFLSVVVIGISYFSLMQLGLASWQVLLSGLVIAFVLSGIQLVAAIRKG